MKSNSADRHRNRYSRTGLFYALKDYFLSPLVAGLFGFIAFFCILIVTKFFSFIIGTDEYLGLDWNEACLQPERSRRVVKTASFRQVRRGVHRESVAKWRRYADQLGALEPLIGESRERVETLAGR